MNKERYNLVVSSQARAEKIPGVQITLSSLASSIQYRNLNGLEIKLRRVHERKLKNENNAYEAEKKKDTFRKNGYKPRTFDDTLNNTARRIKEKSKPYLVSLEERLYGEIDRNITIQIYLKMQRIRASVQFKDVAASYDPPLPVSSVFGMENLREAARKKDVEAYKKAGVPIDDDFVTQIRKRELAQAENIGAFFRNERLFQGIEIRQIAQAFSYQRVTLSEMERGLKPVSKRARKGYEQVLEIKVPKRLLEKQEREKKERFTRARTSNALRLIESENPVPQTLGDFLRRSRLQAGKSLTNLAGVLGRTERNFSLVETAAITVSDQILGVYINELGIEIPEELLEQNRRRKDLIRQRLIAERKSRRTTDREPVEKLQ